MWPQIEQSDAENLMGLTEYQCYRSLKGLLNIRLVHQYNALSII